MFEINEDTEIMRLIAKYLDEQIAKAKASKNINLHNKKEG